MEPFSIIAAVAAAGLSAFFSVVQSWRVDRGASSEKKRLEEIVVARSPESIADDPQFQLLLDYYSQSLAQFKASFRISLFFASLGAIILLSGVAMAVFRADTNGSQYAGVTSTIAGTVASLLSGVLFVYSSRAIKHLDSQTVRLREDRDRERSFERNCTLLDRIKSEPLRDQVTANLVIGQPLQPAQSANRSGDSAADKTGARSTGNGKTNSRSTRDGRTNSRSSAPNGATRQEQEPSGDEISSSEKG